MKSGADHMGPRRFFSRLNANDAARLPEPI